MTKLNTYHRALIIAFAALSILIIPGLSAKQAQAKVTCGNLLSLKNDIRRQCDAMEKQERRYFSEKARLNNEYQGSKRNAPRMVVDKFHRLEHEYKVLSRICAEATQSYLIFRQMAREQGLNCNPKNPTPSRNGQNPNVLPNNGSGPTPKTCPSKGKSKEEYGKGRLQIVCEYHNNGRLLSETPMVEGKKHGRKNTFYDTGDIKNRKDYWNGHLVRDEWLTKSGKVTDCNKYDVEFQYIGSCK